MSKSEYPENDKLSAVSVEYHDIHEFIENLGKLNLVLCDAEGDGFGRLMPTHRSAEQIVAQHLNIDLKKLDEERREMLKSQRESNE